MKKLLLLLFGIYLFAYTTLSQPNVNKINGDAAEYLMNKTFLQNGWRRLPGEIGSNGIDGLYVKYDKNGNIKDVLVAESKYNTSQLSTDTMGRKQLSKDWILDRIEKLKKHAQLKRDVNKVNIYDQILQKVKQDKYRARLFHVKVNRNFMKVNIYKASSSGLTNVERTTLSGNANYKINGTDIDMKNPKDKFENRIVQTFKNGRKQAFIRYARKNNLVITPKMLRMMEEVDFDLTKLNEILKEEYRKTVATRKYYRLNNIKTLSKVKTTNLKLKSNTYWKKSVKTLRKIK